jgi:hypothetical protein
MKQNNAREKNPLFSLKKKLGFLYTTQHANAGRMKMYEGCTRTTAADSSSCWRGEGVEFITCVSNA